MDKHERLLIAGKVAREFQLGFPPKGEHPDITKSIHTDKELAKMAGVGTGTIGRWNQVQKLTEI